jgi:hypothetical protein
MSFCQGLKTHRRLLLLLIALAVTLPLLGLRADKGQAAQPARYAVKTAYIPTTASVYSGSSYKFWFVIANSGRTKIDRLVVHYSLSPAFKVYGATQNNQLVWRFRNLAPGAKRTVSVTAEVLTSAAKQYNHRLAFVANGTPMKPNIVFGFWANK